jgi:predicted permease
VNTPRTVWLRLRSLCRRDEVKREIDEELRFHLEQRTAENVAAGMSAEDAAREARKRFGHFQKVREDCRAARGASFGETTWQDVRIGVRLLRRSPGFAAVSVLSLALGIGANTAIFSLVNAILLRSLPVPNPQELRVIQWSGRDAKTGNFTGNMRALAAEPRKATDWLHVGTATDQRRIADSFSFLQYRALREQGEAQADLFGYAGLYNIIGRGRSDPFVANGLMVSGNFFSGLKVRPALGRLLTAEDDQPGSAPAVVISFSCWEQHFAFDPGVAGRTLALNNLSYTIIGVLPRDFAGVGARAGENEIYVPMAAQPQLMSNFSTTAPDHFWIKLMARLKPGVSQPQLQATLDVAFAAQAASLMKEPRIELSDGRAGPAYDREYYQKPLLILLGAVGTVLLVACANLAGLTLARGAARQHEWAVRAALGAGRRRLIRQSLTETMILAVWGGVLGLLVAVWGRTLVSRLLAGSPEGLRYDLSLDYTVLGFTFIAALLAAVLSGLLPALRAGGVDPLSGIKDRGSLSAPRLRAGRMLVTVQVGLSVLLLVGAGLYVRTLVNLVRVNPGFVTDDLLLFQVNPRSAGLQGAATMLFYQQVQEALASLPGVRSASLVQYKLLAGSMSGGGFFKLPAHPELDEKKPQAHRLTVGETFFSTLGIPLLLGRDFTAADEGRTTKVVVVNETFVRNYLPNEYPIGQVLRTDSWTDHPIDWQIVGVCRDAKYTSIKTDVPPTVYFSYRQDLIGAGCIALRSWVPPLTLVPAVRKALAALYPNVPMSDVTTQKAIRDKGISQETMFATLCGALAVLAVLLASIGLYGLMAYNVARRTADIGIRMALGATRRDIARPVLREALWLAGLGIGIGLPTALAMSRLIQNQLYGVIPTDPVSLIGASALLLAVAVLAAWLPARRAARVDPMVALKRE